MFQIVGQQKISEEFEFKEQVSIMLYLPFLNPNNYNHSILTQAIIATLFHYTSLWASLTQPMGCFPVKYKFNNNQETQI